MKRAWIGISGWSFAGWKNHFYPKGLSKAKELEFASRKLSSIEINGTFYSLQRPTSFQRWYDSTPDDFMFAVKAPQYITHVRRLKEIEEPLANFMASGLLCLKEKLGPILWQFPPNVMLKDDRFERFLKLLPQNSKAMATLAKKHGEKVEGRNVTKAEGDFPVRHAFEFRHKSFANKDFMDLLKAHNVAFVLAHATEKYPLVEDPTANFIYARLHGMGKGYKKGYPPKEIREWAARITIWKKRRDIFIYFSNEAKRYSPDGALSLQEALGISRDYKEVA